MDNLTTKQRSLNMSRIKAKNTSIELIFRRYIWKNGFRGYRLSQNITGKPDIYFPKKRLAVFVDGCFWHKCPNCFSRPKTKKRYWDNKIKKNIKRDKFINKELEKDGIKVIRFWEHEIKKEIDSCFFKLIRL